MDKIRTRKRLVYPENVSQEELKQNCHVSTSCTWMQETSFSSSSASAGQIPEEDGSVDENERCVLPGEVPECDTDDKCNQVTSQLAKRCDSNDSNQESSHSDGKTDSARLDSESGQMVQQRIRSLARAFTERALKVRRRFDFPPTPSTVSSDPDGSSLYPSPMRKKDKIVRWVSQEWGSTLSTCGSIKTKIRNFDTLIHPEGYLYVTWLCLVTMAYIYNCWVIPLRTVFPYQTPENVLTWHCLDYSMDAIYIIDTILVKPRIMYLDDGFWIRNAILTRQNYFRKAQFKTDVLSLVPLDLVYFKTGNVHPLLRLPRVLKLQTFWEFFNHFDKVLPTPYAVRVARSLTYMIYLVHLNACAYYAVSVKEGLGSNSWVFDGNGNAYIRCFYFATKTATSIGKNPRPENELEYLFMTACWLMGVFVFALLIGQIRDIIATATRAQTDYRKRMDETLDYLRVLNLPPKLLDRVKTWFTFTWEQQHTLDESHILDSLPHKMKTDVAINVHINTLNKVQLFKNCDEALLRELVLKLRPVIYLPGDYICRKGEVGKEMYIVKTGKVQVVSGEEGCEVLATLTEGSVFGEISLLSLTGGNRRTADVRSYGFSNLFVLSKDDLNEALIFYPNAQEILKKKAKQLMHQNAAREQRCKAEVVIGNSEPPAKIPRLLPIVMKVVPPDSKTARFLKYGSRYSARACTYGRNDSVRFHSAKKVTRCHSVDLGNIHADYDEKFWLNHQKIICNTFQGHVTVHREMSK